MKEIEGTPWPVKSNRYMFVGVVLLIAAGYYFFYERGKSYIIKHNQLETVEKLTLAKDPKIHIMKGKGSERSHVLLLFEQYNQRFEITGNNFFCSEHKMIKKELEKGDTVDIGLLPDDLNYIKQYTTDVGMVEIYSLKKTDKEYCDLDCANIENKGDLNLFSLMGLFFGSFLFIHGLQKEEPDYFNKDLNLALVIVVLAVVYTVLITLFS